MQGEIDEIIDALIAEDQAARLAADNIDPHGRSAGRDHRASGRGRASRNPGARPG